VTVNERSPVTELQVTACVFGSIYAFHLIRLSGRSNDVPFVQRFPLYDLPFCRYKALKPHIMFRNFDDYEHDYEHEHESSLCGQMLFTIQC